MDRDLRFSRIREGLLLPEVANSQIDVLDLAPLQIGHWELVERCP